MIRILILIHVQKTPRCLVSFQHVTVFVEQTDGFEENIVKIQRVRRGERLLVTRIDLRDAIQSIACGLLGGIFRIERFRFEATDVGERCRRP